MKNALSVILEHINDIVHEFASQFIIKLLSRALQNFLNDGEDVHKAEVLCSLQIAHTISQFQDQVVGVLSIDELIICLGQVLKSF